MTSFKKRNVDKYFFIFIRGIPGSGKSTLAAMLSFKYNLPVIDPDFLTDKHMDFNFFVSTNKKNLACLSEKTIKYRYNLESAINCIEANHGFIWAQAWSKVEGINYTIGAINSRYEGKDIIRVVFDLVVNNSVAIRRYAIKTSNYNQAKETIKTFNEKFEVITNSNFFLHYIINGNLSKDEVFEKASVLIDELN